MTVLTDVPVSGQYYQLGAIAQIVVQILDYTTGLPINLQTATGLAIAIGYPDNATQQTFTAFLYTDGTDGMIAYITRNNGTDVVDLSQVGLYGLQGIASVGGVPITSALTDFYVLPNVAVGQAPPSGFQSSGLILFDSTGVRWALTVDTGGILHWTATPTGPQSFLQLNKLVMKDANGLYWTVTINSNGTYTATLSGSFTSALASFLLLDSGGKSWIVTISTAGVLQAT